MAQVLTAPFDAAANLNKAAARRVRNIVPYVVHQPDGGRSWQELLPSEKAPFPQPARHRRRAHRELTATRHTTTLTSPTRRTTRPLRP